MSRGSCAEAVRSWGVDNLDGGNMRQNPSMVCDEAHTASGARFAGEIAENKRDFAAAAGQLLSATSIGCTSLWRSSCEHNSPTVITTAAAVNSVGTLPMLNSPTP